MMDEFSGAFTDAFKGAYDFFAAFEQQLKTAPVPDPCKCESARDLAVWFHRAARAAGSIAQRGES